MKLASDSNFVLAFDAVNTGLGHLLHHISWHPKIMDKIQRYQAPQAWTLPKVPNTGK